MAAPGLDAAVRARLIRRDDAARFGAILADLPYFDRYVAEVVRYVAGIPARASAWGAQVHDGGAVALLDALLAIARRERDPDLAAIALGLASHCAIDRALHPLINALARRHRGGRNHDASHREVEKFQSVCFHERYLGVDTMGTAAITGYLAIQLADPRRLAGPLGARLREAWGTALGPLPAAELDRFARGYRAHTRLLGSPLGKRVAPPAARAAAGHYLAGPWGAFEPLLAAAIARSVAVVNAAGVVLEADDRDLAAARAALAALLPAGSIDPQGDDLALDQPVVVAL